MGEPVGQLAVVGEQDETLGLGVQTAHVEEPLGAVEHEVRQRGAALGVGHGADDADRLVDGEVDQVGHGRQALAVHVDDLLGRVDPGAEAADHLAVDRHPAVTDHVLAGPAAGHARLGEDLLQPDAVRDLGGVALVGVVAVVEVRVPLGLAGGLEPVVLDRARPERSLRDGTAIGDGATGGGAALAGPSGPVTADRLDPVPAPGLTEAATGPEPPAGAPERPRSEPNRLREPSRSARKPPRSS